LIVQKIKTALFQAEYSQNSEENLQNGRKSLDEVLTKRKVKNKFKFI